MASITDLQVKQRCKKVSKKGTISLYVAVGGIILVAICIHFEFARGWGVQCLIILLAGFEAATAGALADWFAVSALFRKIPIPFIDQHTNIIVRNRDRITDGIVDMVQNRWLTPDAIRDYLAEKSLSGEIVKYIESQEGRMRMTTILRDTVVIFAESLDSKEMVDFLQGTVKNQIAKLDIGQPLGKWLQKSIHSGDFNLAWEVLFDSLEKTFAAPDIEKQVRELFVNFIRQYGDESIGKKFGIWVGEKFHLLDYDKATRLILKQIQLFIRHGRKNPDNPIRVKLNVFIEDFANGLASGNPDAIKLFDSIKTNLIQNADVNVQITKVLNQFKKDVIKEAEKEDAGLIGKLSSRILQLFSDSRNQTKIDLWLQNNLPDFISDHRDDIGEIVRKSLEPKKLSDEILVKEIEGKIYDDLQYIRLNGAVVGGLAGLVFGIIRTVLF
jgi:uncharacterized membrane-anchored protein YjiN (DUF445 family)